MKTRSRQRISITVLFILLLAFLLTNQIVKASSPLSPTSSPPVQGCTPGTDFTTCAFYVIANEDDAGIKPECNNYAISWPELYFGTCISGANSIVSGFRFQNVSLPANQSILASYIEFTVDGPHAPNAITANIYGQASLSPNSFTGTSSSDITGRPTVQPTATWNMPSANTIYNMGDW